MEFFHPDANVTKTHHKLSHWQQGEVPILVTFRLADSLPQLLLHPWRIARDGFYEAHPKPWDAATEARFHRQFSTKLEDYLDAGHGCCALRDPRMAKIMSNRLHHFDGQRYQLWAYVIMPNHVHVLFMLKDVESLPAAVQGWKSVSSHLIQKSGYCALNPFWQPDYFDRLIRSPEHFHTVQTYIRENPMKARLKGGFVLWERAA
ncbi:transposase [soil metagenome]